MRVAVLGLGIMGTGVAQVLHNKGMLSAVYNRSAERAEPFAAQGIRVGRTPREAAEGAEVVIAVLGDDESSRAVWLGENGALTGMSVHAVAVEFSTLSPDWVRELNAAASARNLDFLDAPMTDTKPHAASGQLRLFVGGDPAVLERARPALAAVSTDQFYMGPVGAGATWKLVNNMMAFCNMAAAAEGLMLGVTAGLDPQKLVQVISSSSGNSSAFKSFSERALAGRFSPPSFALNLAHKDLHLALELADELDVPLPQGSATHNLQRMARRMGLGNNDSSAVLQVYESVLKKTVKP